MKVRTRYRFQMPMPPAPWDAWLEECERRDVAGADLLRSLIHGYLIGSDEPAHVTKGWYWRQELHLRTDEDETYRIVRSWIKCGARHALQMRARDRGATEQALVRALVLDLLDGKTGVVQPVTEAEMFEDERRYLVRRSGA